MNWYWLILALVSMSVSGYLIGYANRISEGGTWEPASDWFWGNRIVQEPDWLEMPDFRTTVSTGLQGLEPTSEAD